MTRRPVPLTLAALALTLAALALTPISGCGIATDSHPRPVNTPDGFLPAAASPTPQPATSGRITEQLFLVKDDMLVAVTRHVNRQPTVASLLNDLLAGPTDDERAAGLSSALLGETVVAGIHVNNGQAVVELAATIENTTRNDEVLGYAQLVCTLANRTDISGVIFTNGGQPVAVPRADGSLTATPLTATDYAALIAAPSPAPHPS